MTIQIVGVVGDIKYSDVKDTVPAVFYLPWRQDTRVSYISFYVRSAQPDAVLRTVPGLIKRIDASLPIEDLKTMPQQVRENIFLDRMISILSSAFAVLATLLASIGLYGVLAYSVAQRTREIGVRMALGADAQAVRIMILRQVSVMMLVGVAIGLVGALGLGRAGRSILYGLQEHDPVVLGLSIVMLGLVALGAGYVPARRASEVDPVQALRYE
jgi:ABC-type antimicrobial peptide transport system permease subunit